MINLKLQYKPKHRFIYEKEFIKLYLETTADKHCVCKPRDLIPLFESGDIIKYNYFYITPLRYYDDLYFWINAPNVKDTYEQWKLIQI